MKDCAYFQRLISDSLDRPLETDKRLELESHVNECSTCREFLDAARTDSQTLKLLPVLQHNKPSPRLTEHRKVRRAWKSGVVSVPLPLAALILIVLVGWGTIGWLRPITSPEQKVSVRKFITNIQIERLNPARPVLLTSAEIETKGR